MTSRMRRLRQLTYVTILVTVTIEVVLAAPAAAFSGNIMAATDLSGNPIVKDINFIIGFLSAGVGIVVTGVIILGGIQYMTGGDNPQALSAAKKRIMNGIIALFAFLFISAFLQWLIPGGIF